MAPVKFAAPVEEDFAHVESPKFMKSTGTEMSDFAHFESPKFMKSTGTMMSTATTRSAITDCTSDIDAESTVSSDGLPLARQLSEWSSISSRDYPAVDSIIGRVWSLSCDAEGSRKVQEVIEHSTFEDLDIIASELEGHIAKASRDPHANHVLQKYIFESSPEACQFMVDEISTTPTVVLQAARHRYGCRVLQHLMRRCRPEQMTMLSEVLLCNVVGLSCHAFGTYVMRCFLEVATEEFRYRFIRHMERDAAHFCETPSGCAVLVAAFAHCDPEDAVWLARAVAITGVLHSLAQVRHGNDAAVLVIQALPPRERASAEEIFTAQIAMVRGTRYGRMALDKLQALKDDVACIRGPRCGRLALDKLQARTAEQFSNRR